MANHSTFIAANVPDYLQLEEERLRTGDRRPALAVRLAKELAGRWRALLAAGHVAAQLPKHPASYTYWSMVPIRFGHCVAKYRVLPAAATSLRFAGRLARKRDAMRSALIETLRTGELRFEFQVQLRTSAATMPIEDATVEWPEHESPYRTVAHFIVPPQDVLRTEECDGCERRCFNVWNALPDHRPLGGINRARQAAYGASVAFRTGAVPAASPSSR